MSKKILVILGASHVSGAEKITLDVVKGLKDKEYLVHCLINGWNNGDFIQRLDAMGVEYTSVKLGWYYLSKPLWTLDSLVHFPKAAITFARLYKRLNPDLVYAISYKQLVLLYPFIKAPVVYHVHECHSTVKQSRFFLKHLGDKVAAYIAVSAFIRKDILACGIAAEKISVVYNGIDVLPLPAKSTTSRPFTIGIVGQVIRRKGHAVAIDVLVGLKQKNIDARLIIVGAGDKGLEDELKAKIETSGIASQVEWRGYKKTLYEIYEGIDVVLAPTITAEPFGLMACEANMMQLPAVVSNQGGLPEIIEDGYNGYLFNPADPEAAVNAMLALYKSQELRKQIGENGRKKVIKEFSKQNMIEASIAVMERIVQLKVQ